MGRILTLCVAAAPTHNTLWVYGYRRGRAGRGAFVQWRVAVQPGWLVNLFSCQVMDLRVAERAKRIITLCVAAAPTHNTLWVYGYRRGRAGRTMGVRSRINELFFELRLAWVYLGSFFLYSGGFKLAGYLVGSWVWACVMRPGLAGLG